MGPQDPPGAAASAFGRALRAPRVPPYGLPAQAETKGVPLRTRPRDLSVRRMISLIATPRAASARRPASCRPTRQRAACDRYRRLRLEARASLRNSGPRNDIFRTRMNLLELFVAQLEAVLAGGNRNGAALWRVMKAVFVSSRNGRQDSGKTKEPRRETTGPARHHRHAALSA